jgi:hypothetical protein
MRRATWFELNGASPEKLAPHASHRSCEPACYARDEFTVPLCRDRSCQGSPANLRTAPSEGRAGRVQGYVDGAVDPNSGIP